MTDPGRTEPLPPGLDHVPVEADRWWRSMFAEMLSQEKKKRGRQLLNRALDRGEREGVRRRLAVVAWFVLMALAWWMLP